ncbi:MAG: hypothetical protein HFH23_07130 [Ruminococcus sp.]|nr:hypothetical protein [Ruminococcus sp.]
MTNPQMIAESLLPLILICLFYYMTYFDNKKRFFFALSGIGIFLLLFYTAYYVAYFTCVLLLIFFLCFALIAFLCIPFKNILSSLKKVLAHWPEYLGYLVLCILSMIPFLYLYLPSYNRLGGRSWKDVLMYAPTLPNLIGREIDNFLGFDPTVYHLKMGFPAVFLGLFFFFATWFAVLFLTTRHKDKRCSIQDVLRKSLTVCCIISLFLMIVWGNGICLWYPFFKFLPGASAIRGISRWLAFITLPLSVCFSLLVDKCLKNRQWLRWILLPCLAMFTFLCNHSDVGVSTDWNRASEISFLASVPAPPKDCEIMYLTDKTHTSNDPARTWELQMDAWAIAQFYGLKTVNGYSGQLPNNWDLLIGHDDIDTKVIHWLEGTSVTDAILYSYDIGTHKWSKITFP